MNHHQLPFSMEIMGQGDVEYTFVALEPISQERLDMGYEDMNHKYKFVLCAYDSDDAMRRAADLIDIADVVILGDSPDSYIVSRLKAGKLTFKYSERFYKRGLSVKNFLHALAGAWLHHGRFQKYPLYMLCASAYTAGDAAVFHNYIGRTFKWGYFPEAKKYDVSALMSRKMSITSGLKHSKTSILWAGRLIGWKHPDVSILLAAFLKEKGYSFIMSIIGNGEMEQQLRSMIEEKGVSDCVEMLGAMSPGKVREHMEKADIFLFTSDFNEGWGAVLNESMNSGCAVVASHAIGSVPFLIKDGVNGLVYENGNKEQLTRKVCKLLDNPAYRKSLGTEAYNTISDSWNAHVAATRFVELTKAIIVKGFVRDLFEDGPCSYAPIINNKWYHENEF